MQTRSALTAAALSLAVLSLAGCSGNPLPEPDQFAGPTASDAPDDTPDEHAGDSRTNKDSPKDTNTPEVTLADGEYALEGTLKKLDYLDMFPDDVVDRVREFDTGDVYYAIELDEPTQVIGQAGPGYAEHVASYAIVGELGKQTDSEPNWESYLGRRIRIISHEDEIIVPTDVAIPLSAVLAESKHAVEVLD